MAATLGERILAVIDGGACKHGVESTIVDLRDPDAPNILRPVPSQQTIGYARRGMELKQSSNKLAQAAPGMLTQHYSPSISITLFGHDEQPSNVQEIRSCFV